MLHADANPWHYGPVILTTVVVIVALVTFVLSAVPLWDLGVALWSSADGGMRFAGGLVLGNPSQ